MGGFTKFMEKYLIPILTKIGEEKHLQGIRNGIILTIPFTIAGSIFLIISALPFKGWDELIQPIWSMLRVPVNVTFGAISLIAAVGIGYNLAKVFKLDTIMGAVMSLVGFLILQLTPEYTLSTSMFGAEGLFTAIIIAVFVVEVQRFFVTRNLIIKLPENVPPAIANSFAALIPVVFSLSFLWFVRVILHFNLSAFINTIFAPAVFALNTLPGTLVYTLLVCLLWTVGIHGDSVMYAVGMPIFMQYLAANTSAFMAGEAIPYITAYGFRELFMNVGGTGATIALVFLMLRSRDKGYKALGRISLVPGIFEINEPVTFGFPIVLNPLMMIPFIVTPLVLASGTYALMAFNWIARPVASIPWTMPPIIGPYLVTGGDWRAAVWSAVSIIIAVAIYYPFFKAAEAQRLKEAEANSEFEASA